MWIDDATLVLLEETDWTISNVLNELAATMHDEDFFEGDRHGDSFAPVD